jgi:hypothetical protein
VRKLVLSLRSEGVRWYDADLVEMARTWKFRPATKDGIPVRYKMTIEIRLEPEGP